jgi:hypothetical protein
MLFLIFLGIILFVINPMIGAIYISGMLVALTIGLIVKEQKINKR